MPPPTSPALQGRLVTACANGDFPAALTALANGASVNSVGVCAGRRLVGTPLMAAVLSGHRALVTHLLSLGADATKRGVMSYGVGANRSSVSAAADRRGRRRELEYTQVP